MSAEIGRWLRTVALNPRALAAWAGTDRLSALPALVPRLAARELTPAGAVLALFVCGSEVPLAKLGAIGPCDRELDALHRLGLIDVAGGVVRARVAVLPLGGSLLVCDRLDAPVERDLVCWPDDSSYHLARALPPERCARWLDLGCGSAFAPLLRPDAAVQIIGVDLCARAVRYARLGAQLSGISLTTHEGDLVVPEPLRGACQLVTCNAPIPEASGDPFRAMWRGADPDFVARAFAAAHGALAPGGLIVVHAALDALAPVLGDLPGERTQITYTPDDVRGFAVAWWRPDAPDRHVVARRALTILRPHLEHRDMIEACGALG